MFMSSNPRFAWITTDTRYAVRLQLTKIESSLLFEVGRKKVRKLCGCSMFYDTMASFARLGGPLRNIFPFLDSKHKLTIKQEKTHS